MSHKHPDSQPRRITTPNVATNIVPTNIARVKISGKSPMGLRIPALKIKIVLESNLRKSTMLAGGLGVPRAPEGGRTLWRNTGVTYIYIYIYTYTYIHIYIYIYIYI